MREDQKQTVELRTEMALRYEIDRHLDELIRAAGKRVHLLHDDRAMRESQIRNVLNVALDHSHSHLAVTNFIFYQIGRSGGNQAWMHSDFGKKVVQDIEAADGIVRKLAKSVTKGVCEKVQEANPDEVTRASQLRLMQLYLGYLNRWFYYGSKTRQWQDIKKAVEEEGHV
jgi:hypothetical protein